MHRMSPSGSKGRRRRSRKLWIALAALAAVLIAAPFLFTGAIVRSIVARTPYRAFTPAFQSASLNPLGAVTLSGVTLHDTGDRADQVLLTASQIRFTFSWSEVFSGRFQSIDLQGVRATARSGRTSPLTLLQLGAPPVPTAAIGTARPGPTTAPAAPRPPFQTLTAHGQVLFSDFGPPAAAFGLDPGDTLPLVAHVGATPLPNGLLWDVSLLLGDPEAKNLTDPVLGARAHITATGAESRIHLDSLTLSNVSADLSQKLLDAAHLPPMLARAYAAHLDRLNAAGTVYLAPTPSIDVALEIHELSAKASGDTPLAIDRLSATTRVRGPLTASPLADLSFSRAHCTFDGAQLGQFRLTRASADLSITAGEIGFSELEASVGEAGAQLHASAAWDLLNNIPSRADIDLRFVNLSTLGTRLPLSVRTYLPPVSEGHIDARLFITDAEPNRIVAHLDLSAPDRALVDAAQLPAALAPYMPFRDSSPTLSFSNLTAGATLTWSGRFTDLPDITNGHLAVGSLAAAGEAVDPQQLLSKVSADFAVVRGFARLDDLSFNLPASGKVNAVARYDLARRTLSAASLNIAGADARAFIPWFPQETALAGRLDVSLRYNGLDQPSTLDASLLNDVTLRLPDGTLRLAGSPTLTLRATPTANGAIRLDTALLKGPATLSASAPLVNYLRTLLGESPSSSTSFFERFKEGAVATLDHLELTGRIDLARRLYTGNLKLTDLDAGSLPTAAVPTRVDDLSLAAGVTFAYASPERITLTAARLTAAKLTLGNNLFTAFKSDLALSKEKLTAKSIDFNFADGAFHGDLLYLLPAGTSPLLDHLTLKATHLNQAIVTKNLFPERFTADGLATLTLNLRQLDDVYTGAVEITAESPGMLRLSKDLSQGTFAPAAEAAAKAAQSIIPPNFQQIVVDQLANFPYISGTARVVDTAEGAELHLDYNRAPLKPGDPGYAVPINLAGQPTTANFPVNLKNLTLRLKEMSVADLLTRALGAQDFLTRKPARSAATSP
jgi:hypothetical protein